MHQTSLRLLTLAPAQLARLYAVEHTRAVFDSDVRTALATLRLLSRIAALPRELCVTGHTTRPVVTGPTDLFRRRDYRLPYLVDDEQNMAFSTGTGGVLPHSSSGGHLHVAQGEATDLGAAKLTMLPTDPRERVLAVFPYLPAAYLTDKSVARISAMIDERHSANPQVKAGAEANLKELDELHGA